jgi:ABC-2 type transport system ATP-binding protein
MLTIQNLHKSYGTNKVLVGINLQFEKGKVYGIVGENGAGKTTLFRCIVGFENYEGEITSELNPLKDSLGFLMTEPFFFSKITGREYIQLLCNARNVELLSLDEKNVFDLPLDHYVSTYSTGMKKKLSILAILLQDNQIFILDEPFNGVDIHSNIFIVEIIKKLKALDKTVIMSSHIFSTLSETCDEIYLLSGGIFVKKCLPAEYERMETEMREFTIGSKLDKLGL